MAENSLNSVHISGRIGTDLELGHTPKGTPYLNFRLGVNSTNGDKPTEWFDVTAWEKTAEILAQYRKKGDYVLLVGKLKQDSWTDEQTGEKRYRVRIVVRENVLVPGGSQRMGNGFAGSASGSGSASSQPRGQRPPADDARRSEPLPPPEDDDIPF